MPEEIMNSLKIPSWIVARLSFCIFPRRKNVRESERRRYDG